MLVYFSDCRGQRLKQVFNAWIEQSRNMRMSTKRSSVRSSGSQQTISDGITVEVNSLNSRPLVILERLFNSNITAIYNNCRSTTADQIGQIEIRNQQRRQNLQMLLSMPGLGGTGQGWMKKSQSNDPAKVLINLTGMQATKAQQYLTKCKGDINHAYNLYSQHRELAQQFSKKQKISIQNAEYYLEATNYNPIQALELLKSLQ